MEKMRKIDNVTLVIIAGVDLFGAYLAIYKSIRQLSFAKVKIISPSLFAVNTPLIQIEKPINSKLDSMKEYNRYCVYELHNHIDTEFCLLIQQDGYIINPDLWSDDFLKYDYIGAPWPIVENSYVDPFGNRQRVGNGGFSLRSKKLLTVPLRREITFEVNNSDFYNHFDHGSYSEDGVICIHNRHKFEDDGCEFAPIEVASIFSRELQIPENQGRRTFGFHRYKPK
jgi:hypothetical protein